MNISAILHSFYPSSLLVRWAKLGVPYVIRIIGYAALQHSGLYGKIFNIYMSITYSESITSRDPVESISHLV